MPNPFGSNQRYASIHWTDEEIRADVLKTNKPTERLYTEDDVIAVCDAYMNYEEGRGVSADKVRELLAERLSEPSAHAPNTPHSETTQRSGNQPPGT